MLIQQIAKPADIYHAYNSKLFINFANYLIKTIGITLFMQTR